MFFLVHNVSVKKVNETLDDGDNYLLVNVNSAKTLSNSSELSSQRVNKTRYSNEISAAIVWQCDPSAAPRTGRT